MKTGERPTGIIRTLPSLYKDTKNIGFKRYVRALHEALAELGRAAARQMGIADDVVITMTICPDRETQWPDLGDKELAHKGQQNVG
jgi:hypothetical protein